MLSSAEIGTLITALGTGIGPGEPAKGGFDANKLRYHRIVIMTDADVDGSHIRTLLLTFFFRQMPQLIERGNLYIAQPPLYRAKRGNDERYLKDDRALEDYLLEKALAGARLRARRRARGRRAASCARRSRRCASSPARVRRLAANVPVEIVEQAAVAGALTPDADARAGRGGRRWRRGSTRWRRRPSAAGRSRPAPTACRSRRTVRGVTERHALTPAALRSAEARWLDERREVLAREFGAAPAMLVLDGTEAAVHGPVMAFDRILAQGRKGLTIHRFKGLGEMNPDQLWKTTLDPAARVAAARARGGRGGRGDGVLHPDGRRRGAAARLHRDQRAEGCEPRRLAWLGCGPPHR